MSTIRGKGWRPLEGIEKVLQLSPLARAWTTRPQNFDRIQAVLDAVPAARNTLVQDTADIHNMSFSGARASMTSREMCRAVADEKVALYALCLWFGIDMTS